MILLGPFQVKAFCDSNKVYLYVNININITIYLHMIIYILRISFTQSLVQLEQLAALSAFSHPLCAGNTREAPEKLSPRGCSWGEEMWETNSCFLDPFPVAHPSSITSPAPICLAGGSLPLSGWTTGPFMVAWCLPRGGSFLLQP